MRWNSRCISGKINWNSIYVKKNMLFFLELSSRDLSDRQSREKATKPLQYVSYARKSERNVWEYPACFAGVCLILKMADFTAKRSIKKIYVRVWNRFKHGRVFNSFFIGYVSKPIHMTRIRCSGWVRAAWIINEFEKYSSHHFTAREYMNSINWPRSQWVAS